MPYFNLLHMLAQILKSIVPAMHACTEGEANNLGIFFNEFFAMIHEWSKDEVWASQCEGYAGFSRTVGSSNQSIKLSEFCRITLMIQKTFTQNLSRCLELDCVVQSPLRAQCALKVLNRMLAQYPTKYKVGILVQKNLQVLVDNKSKIEQGLHSLATAIKDKLQRKLETLPDKPAEEAPTAAPVIAPPK